jgi:hypothetical protein
MIIPSNNPYIKKHSDGTYTIHSGLPEFGYELLSAIPLAHHLYEKGLLRSTISGFDTKCLYWFSPNHSEIKSLRSYDNVEELNKEGYPNINIHSKQLDWDLFSPPNYKKHYKKFAIKFSKPTVVITNRINSEWNQEPVNYLDAVALNKIFNLLREKYQVVYIETSHFSSDYEDHSKFKEELNQNEQINYSGIIKFSELLKAHSNLTINELQCRLYSGCERFLSSNGGLGIFTAYFGGENIIFSKKCHEIDPDVNSFYGWYARISGASITVARNVSDLLVRIIDKWVKDLPLFNILIRTSGRPNYFHDCIKSILDQDYSNHNIIVGCDDPNSMEYIQNFPCVRIPLKKYQGDKLNKPKSEDYGVWFPFNSYFSELQKYANNGYIIYLDDDDCFVSPNALSQLSKIIKDNDSNLIFWRVKFPNRLVPSDSNWILEKPINRDMSTIGFCHATQNMPKWEPWKRGDYRVANYLFNNSDKIFWLNEILTGLQRVIEDGFGTRDDKNHIDACIKPSVKVIIPAFEAWATLEQCLDSILAQKINFSLNVMVGVDCCSETIQFCKKLTLKYDYKVSFFRSTKNCGPYIIKNSLARKIVRHDSLILTFDADDLMPANFLQAYYDYYTSLPISRNNGRGILKSSFVDWLEDENDMLLNKAVEGVLKSGCFSTIAEIFKFKNRLQLNRRYKKSKRELRSVLNPSVGVLMFDYISFESLGFYNEFRVAQDTDLVMRSELMGMPTIHNSSLPWFLRRVSVNSLEFSSETGMGSPFREEIKKENNIRIKSGILIAKGVQTKLRPIL